MAVRAFEGYMPSRWVAHTASDATDITGSIGVFVNGAGTVVGRFVSAPDTDVELVMTAGSWIPGNFTRVMAASTATGIRIAYP